MQNDLTLILTHLLERKKLTPAQAGALAVEMLADPQRARALGLTPANIQARIQVQGPLFCQLYPAVQQLWQQQFQISTPILVPLWQFWFPLALQLAQAQQDLGRSLIQGVLGGQGTGKTTLCAMLGLILRHLGYSTLCLSLDDLYKTYAERQALRQQDPRLIWRGPPGTHDLELGLQVLDHCRQATPGAVSLAIPRFDKLAQGGAGDRMSPEVVRSPQIVLFEGWFVGLRPIDPAQFDTAPAPILTPADRQFARDMNTELQNYLPLWQRLDRLILLKPVDYRLSQEWRRQAEQKARVSQPPETLTPNRAGMSDAEVNQFVEYFWQALHPELFIPPLLESADQVDLVLEIQADHSLGRIYRPGERHSGCSESSP